jgi:hypothetical protein
MKTIDQQVTGIVSEANIDEWSRQYWAQGEFFCLGASDATVSYRGVDAGS